MSRARALRRALLLAAAVVAADQVTKAILRGALERGDRRDLVAVLDLVHVRNTGVAFGLLSGGGVLLVAVGALALAALLGFLLTHADRPLVWLPAGLLLGGAAGNLLDRVREGFVTDFLKLPGWPAFNVADIAITVGVVTLVYVLEGPPRRREAERRAALAQADGG